MCRLDGCRQPARVSGPNRSKYCSDGHGILFMKRRTQDVDQQVHRKHTDGAKDSTANLGDNDTKDGEGTVHLRGGEIRARELKTLASGVKDIDEFRKLGQAVSNPADIAGTKTEQIGIITYTSDEKEQLQVIRGKRGSTDNKLSALNDKETFLTLIKTRAKAALEELKKTPDGPRDICGFDARLSWSDEEFDGWRASAEGQEALKSGILPPPSQTEDQYEAKEGGDTKMTNGVDSRLEELTRGVCLKKRCERHKTWFKLNVQDIAFERNDCQIQLRKLEKEESELGQRAMLRTLESVNQTEDKKAVTDSSTSS